MKLEETQALDHCDVCGIELAPLDPGEEGDGNTCVACTPYAPDIRRAKAALDLGHIYGIKLAEVELWRQLDLTKFQQDRLERLHHAFLAAGSPAVGDEFCEAMRAEARTQWDFEPEVKELGYVRGCVHAAATAVLAGSLDFEARLKVKPTRDLTGAIELTFQRNREELKPLTGTDAIWKRLAELHLAADPEAGQLDIFGETQSPDPGPSSLVVDAGVAVQQRLFEPQMEGQLDLFG